MKENNLINKSDIQLAFPKISRKTGKPIAKRSMRCRCHSDHMHKSKFEASVCNTLRLRKLAGDIADYKSQPRFELKVNGKKVCNHYPDFLILNNNGSEEILEAKSDGTVTQLWRLKKALTEILFPDIPYKVEWQKRSNYPLKMMLKGK